MKITSPTCKKFVINALRFIVKPMTCQPAFFALLFLLLGVPDIYSLLVLHSFLPLFKTSFAFFSCYILALPVVYLPGLWRKVYKTILLIISSIFFTVDIYLLLLYGDTFSLINKDAVAAVLGTNPTETVEYISTYFAVDKLLLIVMLLSILYCVAYRMRKLQLTSRFFMFLLLVFLFVSAVVTMKNYDKIKESNFYYLLTREECPDLREYRQNPAVLCNGERVDNIVLLIGESYSKFQSSLYGYGKETNPFLESMRCDSTLLVYENVTSACVSTIPAIKSIMMSYMDYLNDSIKWYKCLTLIEVMSKADYSTYWLSNQSKTGLFDNEVGAFSDLCDKQYFIGDKHSGGNRSNKDEELLPILDNSLLDTCSSKFIIMQLSGSHTEYKKRYPRKFAKFNADDYEISHSHLSKDKRQMVAEYDNTVLYNDSVVYELMLRFCDEDAVILCFSDHGEDVFHTGNNFIGHGSLKHSYATMQIPFMVYTSPIFREKHPELQLRIENAVDRPYRTDSIMYTIMDVAGVETVNGISYKHKSLFK